MVERASPKRIALVADDDPLIARVLSAALEMDGWTVITAADGATTVSAIAGHPLDLCIMDRFMPGPSLEIRLAELRRHRPAAAVIMLSGSHDETGVPEGAVVLRKPVGLDELREGIARAGALAAGSPTTAIAAT